MEQKKDEKTIFMSRQSFPARGIFSDKKRIHIEIFYAIFNSRCFLSVFHVDEEPCMYTERHKSLRFLLVLAAAFAKAKTLPMLHIDKNLFFSKSIRNPYAKIRNYL